MKNLKKLFAATLAVFMMSTQAVSANALSPTEVLTRASEHSLQMMTGTVMTGEMSGALTLNGEEIGTLQAALHMAYALDPDEDIFKLYMRAPMVVQGIDPFSGTEINEAIEVVYFLDTDLFAMYVTGMGWMAQEIESDKEIFSNSAVFNDLDAMMQWGLEIDQRMIEVLSPVFALHQPSNTYVVDMVITNDTILDLMNELFTVDFMLDVLDIAFTSDDRELLFGDATEAEIVAEFEAAFDLFVPMLEEFLDMADISILYRVNVNRDTFAFESFDFDVVAVVDVDRGFLGSFDVEVDLFSTWTIDYTTEIEWPVIDLSNATILSDML